MKVQPLNLAYYVDLLAQVQPFAFARYGNGEWGCILRTARVTGSGSQKLNIAALRAGLVRGIVNHATQEHYYLGMQSRGYLRRVGLEAQINGWLKLNAPTARWVEGEVFHKASMKGKLAPLVRQLREMKVVVVGPRYLQALRGRVFDYEQFVAVAPRNCFTHYKQLRDALFRIPEGRVIAFSAGPTTKALINGLWREKKGNSWLIDFGSLWDPYCGRETRRYHARITKKVQAVNLA